MAIAKSYSKRRLVLTRKQGVPANALKANAKYILVNGRYLTVTS